LIIELAFCAIVLMGAQGLTSFPLSIKGACFYQLHAKKMQSTTVASETIKFASWPVPPYPFFKTSKAFCQYHVSTAKTCHAG